METFELPWLVTFGETPPPELNGHQGGIVQAPRRSLVDSLQAMRHQGMRVGAVLICLVHELAHAPIDPEDGPWQWPPPSALYRRLTTRCSSPDGSGLDYRPCTARFWLQPPERTHVLTDGVALYDTLCRVRSLRRHGPNRFTTALPMEALHPEESPQQPHQAQDEHGPHQPADVYYRWTS
ncbi:hypothetical protein [Streptomyces sp. JJ38]|uniref:hypothetical protein n=1 Tax=Streptomyces sp. JJ38 TaxID=2738128 RepID=UPI001C56D513|nr:hypothetical protein [Streptomyces sp. JJ38]MBW1596147.1 hypothetical protein [Streptomyces sp. JJ38]